MFYRNNNFSFYLQYVKMSLFHAKSIPEISIKKREEEGVS